MARGLRYENGLLVIIDGSKGLRAGVEEVFGPNAVVQRCQYHKRENVVAYLPKSQQELWRSKLAHAYAQPTYAAAKENPAAQAEAPRRARVRLDVWTEAQTLLFLSEARASSRHYPLYLFLVGTGCRIGEALGVTWRDLSPRDGTVTIAQALQRPRGGGYTLRDPKTSHSRRTITLPDELAASLRALRAYQDEERARCEVCPDGGRCRRQHCARWHALDLVFCQPSGKPLHDNNIRQRDLRPICDKLGLPYHRALHNLRHRHATMLLQRGVSVKVVQERLGHGAAAFTLSVYGHVLAGMQAGAAQAVSAMLRACDSFATPSGEGRRAETLDKSGVRGDAR